MNIYALFPFVATIAYIPLLATAASSRPLSKRHKQFLTFLIPAMAWSLTDYVFRMNISPDNNFLLLKVILVMYVLMAVQFHYFVSSFYAPGEGRWLPLSYGTLGILMFMIFTGFMPQGVGVSGDRLYPQYGPGIFILAVPLLTLASRSFYIFIRKLKIVQNPVMYNQIVSLILGLAVLVVFTFLAIIPWGREFPIVHFGNLVNAFILSYATLRHQLIDIRLVVQNGLSWTGLVIAGLLAHSLILFGLNRVFRIDVLSATAVTLSAIIVGVLTVRWRQLPFMLTARAFQGKSYDYRRKLYEFAGQIHNVFSLREQGGELLSLVTRAVNCRKAALFFLDLASGDFLPQFMEPATPDNPMAGLQLRNGHPILVYLDKGHKLLTRDNMDIMPELYGLWTRDREQMDRSEIELLVPLISREKLIGILALDQKRAGRYSLEDLQIIQEITTRVAVSMEKEYLREQLKAREEELSIINRTSTILTSSLNIQHIYDSFINELKKIVDVNWAAISLVGEKDLQILALSSDVGSAWQAGERLPIKGSASEWLGVNKKPLVEPDLTRDSRFATGKYHLQHGIRSIAYIPLLVDGELTGNLIVASRNPNAYSPRHISLLEQLASQIAMPVKNSCLFARAEERARIDELTGLLNRRSLDEMLASEIGRHSRYGGVFSLIILDLDLFKVFNDNYGHVAGDKLLTQVGSYIKASIRNADQAFRYGGDEFAVLLPHTTIETACQVAERVRQRIATSTQAGHLSMTVSMGISSWPADGLTASELINAADEAMYEAKRAGRNRACCSSGTPPETGNPGQTGKDANSEVVSGIYALAAAVDARDELTRDHSRKVSEYAVVLAEALKMDPLEVSKVSTCALLHDIGKVGINDDILKKASELTEDDWKIIKSHPQLGAATAGHAPHLSPCILGILYHHERYDGTGYPKGLKGEQIPLEARILAIADAFAAMTSNRAYSEALSFEQAKDELSHGAGTQFDPKLVKTFLSIFKKLNDGSSAVPKNELDKNEEKNNKVVSA